MDMDFVKEVDCFIYGGYSDWVRRDETGCYVRLEDTWIPVEDWKKKHKFPGARDLTYLARYFYNLGQMGQGRKMRMLPSSDELLPNLATTEQWRRLVASGLPSVTYSLAVLWNIVHGMDCIYEFDNTMAADELIEELVSIIELEACAKKQKTES